MLADQEKKIQIRVGFFTLIGLILMAIMVTYFGRLGENLKGVYDLRVEYPNANGLLLGSDVLLAGAKVGKVAEGPFILPRGKGVYVILKIYDQVEIPANSRFTIGSSGMLGDHFVDIAMLPPDEQTAPLKPNSTIKGLPSSGIGELATEGGLMLAEIREAVQTINTVVKRIDEQLLTEKTLTGVTQTISSLRETSESLAGTSKQLDGLMADSSRKIEVLLGSSTSAVEEGKKALTSAAIAAKEIQSTSVDFRKIMQDIRHGKGVLGLLLSDEEAATNIRAIISNLRSRGILFYRDQEPKKRP